ncbi:hypothetical protein F5J12DRAFT_887699 [Pisolithus orientalis]|uniref:uncharacterized protein n=1 Tax=Pisolithus orientalis TaxID=936130 RepID=UPI00222476BE|nr:uncharacterized protein F5J12DRAFT_887699 [Pisolithus orientalis]KAI6032821.1 hypothetical protein F5J12DRAFT_887699 [Pisolithus orientalis]
MPSLSDHIDHLTATAKAIHTSATSILPTDDNPAAQTGPFTRAVLDTPLGDLIRDIDTSELGLFSLVPPPDAGVRKQPENGPRKGEISRAGFPGATPLRRLPTKRDEATKPREPEPEVYAMAALKYLDRYQSIRPMPRARSQVIALTQQLTEVRANIKHLNETLHQSASSAPSSAPTQTSSVAEEENRIHELQDRLAELRLQKESLLRAKEPRGRHNNPSVSSKSNLSPNHRDTAFWSTPSTPARTLRFSEKLMDEEIKFGDVSTISFDSPEPVAPSVFANLTTGGGISGAGFDGSAMDDSIFDSVKDGGDMGLGGQPESALSRPNEIKIGDHGGGGAGEEEGNGEEEGEGEEKIVPYARPNVDAAVPLVESRVASNASKVKVTPELERIVAKIWSTVGEIILPGSPYSNGAKPPRAKETLAHIQVLAVQSPTPQSPTSSSVSSLTSILSSGTGGGPTPHQINTAQLLYTLLTAPGFAMQLNKLKAAIGGTRVLYACVAKKLIRIDRSSGEQVVHFDV